MDLPGGPDPTGPNTLPHLVGTSLPCKLIQGGDRVVGHHGSHTNAWPGFGWVKREAPRNGYGNSKMNMPEKSRELDMEPRFEHFLPHQKKSTDYMTYIITHGPPQSPHRYTTNVAPRINSFKWQVLNICRVQCAQSGGHGSTTQNLRQSLGFHTFPVSKSSAPLTKQSNLRQESAQLRKNKNICAWFNLCGFEDVFIFLVFFWFGQILQLKKLKNRWIHINISKDRPSCSSKKYWSLHHCPAWRWKAPRHGGKT